MNLLTVDNKTFIGYQCSNGHKLVTEAINYVPGTVYATLQCNQCNKTMMSVTNKGVTLPPHLSKLAFDFKPEDATHKWVLPTRAEKLKTISANKNLRSFFNNYFAAKGRILRAK